MPTKKKKFSNKWSRWLHRWGSILIALPILLVIATGIVLQLKKQVAWVQPPSQRGSAAEPTLAFDRILEIARTVPEAGITGWDDIDRLDVRPSKGMLKVRAKNSWEIQLDAASGDILQVAYRRSDLIESLHDGSFFHDQAKLWLFLPAALVLLGLWLTGIYLFILPYQVKWKRRKKVALDDQALLWKHERLNDSDEKPNFAIFSDLTGGEREHIFEVAVAQLNLLPPEMIMCRKRKNEKKLFYTILLLVVMLLFSFNALATEKANQPRQVLIKNVNIFDGKNEKLAMGQDVLVENNLIKKIGKGLKADSKATVIDGGGRVLTPGFIDAHTHIALIAPFDQLENEYTGVYVGAAGGQMAENMLMRGFTTVRDAGGASIGIQRAIDDGWFPGPRIFSSGAFITQTSGHLDMRDRTNPHKHAGGHHSHAQAIGHFAAVDGKAEMLAAARQQFRDGATQLKLATNGGISAIYSPLDLDQFTDDELGAAAETADAFGSYFMVHAYYDNAVSRAIDFGAKSIEHGHLMTEESVKKMKENNVYLVVEALMSLSEGSPDFTPAQQEKFDLAMGNFKKMLELAKKYKIKIALGSDTFLSKAAYDLQAQEWTARAKLFSSAEIMKQATSIGAELIELSGERNRYREGPLGVVQEGAYADLIIVEGNPLEDVTILSDPDKNLKLIMKDGDIYKNTLR